MLLLLFQVRSATCQGQQNAILDSLQNLLQLQKSDTGKVNTLNAISRHLWQTANYLQAKMNADDAFILSEKINYKRGISNALLNLGIICTYEGNYPGALKNFFSSLEFSENGKNKKELSVAYNGIAGVYANQGSYPEALKYLNLYLKISQEIKDKRGVANAFNNMGFIYNIQGNYTEALKSHFASLKIKEEIGDKKGVSNSLANIGLIYERQNNYSDALVNYFASLKIKEEVGDRLGIANTNNNIGIVYTKQANYPDALKYCLLSLKINEEIKAKKGIALSYNSIGMIFDSKKDYNEALKNHFAALKIREQIGDKQGIACSYINIGESYTYTQNFTEAKKFLEDGLTLCKNIGSKDDIKESYQRLARLDSATSNWEGAYRNQKLFILYRDSLINETDSKKMLQLQMQYEFERKEDQYQYQQNLSNEKLKQQTLLTEKNKQSLLLKEKEFTLVSKDRQLQQLEIEKNHMDYAAQKAETEKKQVLFIVLNKEKQIQQLQLKKQREIKNYLLAGLILFSILSFFVYRSYRTRQKLKLQTLRNKIASDLHDDVGSTLSSISIFSQIAQQQSREAIPLLETINESSQKMLEAMADIVWTIKPENDQFENIILRMRSFAFEFLGARDIDFEFSAGDDIAKLKLPMNVRKNLYLIFKEATNNLVKYSGANKAYFTVNGEKNNLSMLVQDNGKGFNTGQQTEGNGLKNMKRRAAEIGAKLIIDSYPGKGTTVQLNLSI
jgi:two-component system, NarL family, sensor histidine kinase UhpB